MIWIVGVEFPVSVLIPEQECLEFKLAKPKAGTTINTCTYLLLTHWLNSHPPLSTSTKKTYPVNSRDGTIPNSGMYGNVSLYVFGDSYYQFIQLNFVFWNFDTLGHGKCGILQPCATVSHLLGWPGWLIY